MRKRLIEGSILLVSVAKWSILATVIGVIVGISTTIFLKLLGWSTMLGSRWTYTFLLLPVAMFTSALLIKVLAPDAEGHGTEKVIEAIHRQSGKIQAMVVPVKLVATIITLAFGGSAGKEGPCAQIGAGLASVMADLLRLDDQDRQKVVICGISAGFASVFGTPIAGAIFGVEVLFAGRILYDGLLPSFIAGMMSYQTTLALGMNFPRHTLKLLPTFDGWLFVKMILAGIFFGLCAMLLIETLAVGKKLSAKVTLWKPYTGILGGLLLLGLALLFSKQFLGLGVETIDACLAGQRVVWYAFALKILFTSITLNFGGSGGIVTPIFFVGTTSGVLFGMLTHSDTALFAAIGMTAFLGGAANTPLAASIMAVELFGQPIAPYATIACVISFLMTGHRSVYPSQVLGAAKSASLHVEVGKEMSDLHTIYQPHTHSLINRFSSAWNRLRRKGKSAGK